MNTGKGHFLVVGGGVGGMSAAISLRMQGASVDLIDIDPQWKVLGAGISIGGATLRAFRQLGVMDQVAERGHMSESLKFFSTDGRLLQTMQVAQLLEGVPANGGILRPDLHNILSEHVKGHGANVRLGLTVSELSQDAAGVDVTFTDGTSGRYDGVIGADGLHSAIRSMILPDAPGPSFTGQGCWRMVAPRPADMTGPEIYFGPGYKIGFSPCSQGYFYLFVTITMPGNPFIPETELEERLRVILAPFGGRVPAILEQIGPDSNVNYRPLDGLLLPPPWHVGRVGLIGDAIHATTPHLAAGAGMAVEDGLLLGEYLAGAADIDGAWRDFEARRWPRVRLVTENSFSIGKMEQEGGKDAQAARLMAESANALAQPI